IAGASPAAAGEKYRVDSLYARWRTVTKVDGVQTREYWYVEAYSSTSRFRAYLDHLIYECTRQNGRLRCDRTLWESGRVGNAAASGFVFDRKLGSAGLDATFRLE